ncbi:VOC family protein [Novosphingobium sp.]|uniref:VOC family protein n=1 Tax=Novosphingobium sp. TaxID=1874826 RepID=UPI00333FC3BF
MGVDSLGYIALTTTKMDEWRTLLERVFGMEPRMRDGAIDYRIDGYHHRITLTPDTTDSVEVIGWELGSSEALATLVKILQDRGVAVTMEGADLRARRKVKELCSFTCPMIGNRQELYYGPLISNTPFAPSRGISGYKTGTLGLGHVVYWVKDLAASVKFYQDVMGFAISDYIAWDNNDAVFMHCNRRHHTLALMQDGPNTPAGALMHLMVEANSYDDVGYGYDLVRDMGIPVMIEPGKHSNDHMQSFYLQTPSGFWLEYGYGGIEIGPDWQVRNYDAPMLWGHRFVGS